VRLHFAEIYWTQAQKRLFNVNLGGRPGSEKFGPVCAIAGPKTAHVAEYVTTVTNGFSGVGVHRPD
jgi:hypothetical protein